MKVQSKIFMGVALLSGALLSGAAIAQEADPLAACVAGVKANTPAEQYTEEGATAFCGCVGEKAGADANLAAELESVQGKSQEEAQAILSDSAKEALNSCVPA